MSLLDALLLVVLASPLLVALTGIAHILWSMRRG